MINTDNPLRGQRHYIINKLSLQFNDSLKGNVCEIGCWYGLSAYQIVHHSMNNMNKTVLFHIFDSFKGLSKIEQIDKQFSRIQNDDNLSSQFKCSLGTVQKNLKEFNFIQYHKWWVPDKFYEVKNRTFPFVHIDLIFINRLMIHLIH